MRVFCGRMCAILFFVIIVSLLFVGCEENGQGMVVVRNATVGSTIAYVRFSDSDGIYNCNMKYGESMSYKVDAGLVSVTATFSDNAKFSEAFDLAKNQVIKVEACIGTRLLEYDPSNPTEVACQQIK